MYEFGNYPSLQNIRVLITGGANGIGAAMVKAFSEQGAIVGFIDIDGNAAEQLCDFCNKKTAQVPWYRNIDISNTTSVIAAVREFSKAHHGIDTLINNAANDNRHDPLKFTQADWRKCMSINLDAAFFASQTAIELMIGQGRGNIINMSSIVALKAPDDMSGYVAAKAALLGLTQSLAKQFGPSNIRVNAILPGWVATERQLDKWLTKDAEQKWMTQTALKQRITPRDIANLALFLAAEDSAMITGQNMIIDGGHL